MLRSVNPRLARPNAPTTSQTPTKRMCGVGIDDDVAVRLADAVRLDPLAEIECRRGAAAEADDVDDLVAVRPLLAQVVVRFVDADQLAHAEKAADELAEQIEARADARDVEVLVAPAFLVCLGEPHDVRVFVLPGSSSDFTVFQVPSNA